MKYNLKNRPKLSKESFIIYGLVEEWFEGFEKRQRNMNFEEWIQENQEDLPLGYSKAELLQLYVKKEILGE